MKNPANCTDGVTGSLEDGPHLYAIEWAKYEQVELHHLLNETADGNVIFTGFDPLEILPQTVKPSLNPDSPCFHLLPDFPGKLE